MDFSNLKDRHKGETMYVLGASRHMDWINPAFFEGKLTIGCNFVFKRFPVKYTLSRHWAVIKEWINDPPLSGGELVHHRFTTDLGGFEIAPVGYTFSNELMIMRGVAPTAIDLARYMGAKKVVLFGLESNLEYMNDYNAPKDETSLLIYMDQNRMNIDHAIRYTEGLYGVAVTWIK